VSGSFTENEPDTLRAAASDAARPKIRVDPGFAMPTFAAAVHQTTATRIFSPRLVGFWLYISMS